jgi:hypothetical protein
MHTRRILLLGVVVLSFAGGCRRQPGEGPAQRAGRAVDDAARKTKDVVKDAAHDTKKKVEDR